MSFLFRFHDIIGGIHVPVDDGVDKLNRKYTLLVFLFLALPIFTKQYIGDPIECFAPVYFAEHQSRYINSYCWTQSTYYMVPVGDPDDDGDQQEPNDRIMPDEVDYFIGFETVTHIGNERLRRVRVSYYQWAPLILLVQGLCFYIPFLIWNSCANNAGVKLRRLLKKASDIASLPPGCQQREALLAEFVDQFHTLVTGEAGWCADMQCQGAGSQLTAGSSSSSSSASQSASSGHSAPGQGDHSAGQGGRRHQQQQQQQQHNSNHSNHSNHNSNSNNNNNHSSSQQSSCCLVGIPIIGSLLACCLRPCSSFGLVGPSKYLCLLYLAVKSAYVLNVGLQFFLLGQFLGRGYLRHGLELMSRLLVNGDWWASPRFPLSTLCQVRADMSGGLRSYTCQCVLPINVFNEKIFSVVWFYMAFLMPLNVLSLLFWIYRTFETNRLSYIRLCLWRTRLVELNQIHRTVRRLSQLYLGWDGVFLLRLIEHNHGSIMATLIMSRLWEFYANHMKLQEDANQLALASNAQHTLSNTTTAISNQHQLLAAAAAAAGQQAHGPPSQLAGQPPPPLMAGHQVGHAHPGHAHPGLQHAHGPAQGPQAAHFGAHQHGHPHFNPQAAGGGNGAAAGLLAQHPAHVAHHSGQVSQPGNHHPLHAANTHHHAHHAHLGGPFAGQPGSASILAQLQHQHQQQHQQQQQHNQHQAGQPHGAGAATQQPAPGNVAAAVAALAAAAAANSSANQSATTTPGQQQPPVAAAAAAPAPATTAATTAAPAQQPQQQQAAATPAQQAPAAAAGTSTTSFITPAAGPPLPPPPPAHVVAAVAAAVAGGPAQPAPPGLARPPAGRPQAGNPQQQQQQQQPAPPPHSNPILFNLKSSSLQAAPSAAPNSRYAAHTLKRA